MTDPIVVTRTLVKRPLTDIEPKVMWALIAGGIALFALLIVKDQGVVLSPLIEQATPYVIAILAGYATPSAGQTITTTKNTTAGRQVQTEAHTGPAETIVTGPTPVQMPDVQVKRASFTDVVENTPRAQDDKPTQVIPGTILPTLNEPTKPFWSGVQSGTGPQSIDGH